MEEEAYQEMLDVIDSEYDRIYWYDLELIHGDCPNSPDQFAVRLGEECGCEVRPFPADWGRHKKRAGFIRNNEMVCQDPDLCIAIWDGISKGTEDTIVRSVRHGIHVRIIPVDELPKHSEEG